MFEFLFKYRPLLFEQGDFAFGAPRSVRLALVGVSLVALAAVLSYALARGEASRLDRGVMAGLRLALLGLLLFCLLQPMLVLSTVVPQRNFLGVLVDDSRSMLLEDSQGRSRSDFVREAFTPDESELLRALADRFTLRFFRFSSTARRMDGPDDLAYSGTRTDLARALDLAREELSGLPLSGLVLVTDGADNGGHSLGEALVPLQAAGVPVFTVGLGEETLAPDVELGRIQTPRVVLEGTSLMVDVVVSQVGFSGRTVPILVEDETRLLAEDRVELGPDGEPVVARVALELEGGGARMLRFRVPAQEGERVTENNVREVQVEVLEEREKVLYFEGEPRFEVAFMRRAVQDDDNVQLVVLQRTAENKYLRLSVDDSQELQAGFPRTREELYRYRGLILGSVEASFFTHDQLQMIADFVSERGGGLLMLGGRDAFAEGGWAGTPVDEVMPVVLDDPTAGPEPFFAEVKVGPTPAGAAHPATQLAGPTAEGDVRERWEALPPVSVANPIHEVRLGATALLTGSGDGLSATQVVLAHQRYGRGKALALTVQDSWRWQMETPPEDQSYETFWRQMLRWLVDGVPDAVAAVVTDETVEPGEGVRVLVDVGDSSYLEVNDAMVTVTVTGPTDSTFQVPAEWTVEADGQYAAEFAPSRAGEYEIAVEARRGERVLGADVTYVTAGPSTVEYFGAGMHARILRRIAEETGGRFYTPETVGTLPEDISVTGAGVTLVEEKDLWDMPVLFLVALVLMGAEWGYRRARGLV